MNSVLRRWRILVPVLALALGWIAWTMFFTDPVVGIWGGPNPIPIEFFAPGTVPAIGFRPDCLEFERGGVCHWTDGKTLRKSYRWRPLPNPGPWYRIVDPRIDTVLPLASFLSAEDLKNPGDLQPALDRGDLVLSEEFAQVRAYECWEVGAEDVRHRVYISPVGLSGRPTLYLDGVAQPVRVGGPFLWPPEYGRPESWAGRQWRELSYWLRIRMRNTPP